MSGDSQSAADRAAAVRRQLISVAIDDIFSLLRGVSRSGQPVDGEVIAAVKRSAITITPESSTDDTTEFWRNYAALIVAVRPRPDEEAMPALASSRRLLPPRGLTAAAAAPRRRFAGWVVPTSAGAAAALFAIVIAASGQRDGDGLNVQIVPPAAPVVAGVAIPADELPTDLRPDPPVVLEALIDGRQMDLWRLESW